MSCDDPSFTKKYFFFQGGHHLLNRRHTHHSGRPPHPPPVTFAMDYQSGQFVSDQLIVTSSVTPSRPPGLTAVQSMDEGDGDMIPGSGLAGSGRGGGFDEQPASLPPMLR